jgi:hypothetical protein
LSNAAFYELDRVCIDHEDEGVSLNDLKAFAQALCDQGVTNRIALYSGFLIKEQAPNKPDAELALLDLWLAEYSSNPTWPTAIWSTFWAWQFTDGKAGPQPRSVAGIPGDSEGAIDINQRGGTRHELERRGNASTRADAIRASDQW